MQKTLAFLALSFFLPALAAAQQALLWVPTDAPGMEGVIAALESDGGLKLTAAFPSIPKNLEERVRKLEKDGRLELALRPAGDPPLPLLYYPASGRVNWSGKPSTAPLHTDQYFLALRLSLARDAALKVFKKAPGGLVSPPGGVVADYFPLAKALGAKWLACGPLAAGAAGEVLMPGSKAAAVLEAGGVYAVPFVNFSAAPSYAAGPSFTIFDETSSPDPAALRAMLGGSTASEWTNAAGDQLDRRKHLVAGDRGSRESHVVYGGEVGQLALGLGLKHQDVAADLRHMLHQQHAGEYRLPRQMALQYLLVGRYVLKPHAPRARLVDLDYPVNEQERVTVRDYVSDLLDVDHLSCQLSVVSCQLAVRSSNP